MQQTASKPTKPRTPQPWDFIGIYRYQGLDGIRRRYFTLVPFAELVRTFGDALLLFPQHWYRSPAICMSLAALQAQWDECNSTAGKAWVASRFWTQDLACLREICKGSGVDTPPDNAHKAQPLPTFNEYLESPEFAAVCKTLQRMALWQAKVEDLNNPGKGSAR
jgi:hypothetical protein